MGSNSGLCDDGDEFLATQGLCQQFTYLVDMAPDDYLDESLSFAWILIMLAIAFLC